MGRKLRLEYEGSVHHAYVRGNECKPIFRCDDDCRYFLNLLDTTANKFRWSCLGYALMINHYHLLIKNHAMMLSKGMHWLGFMYAQYFNKKYERVGHLAQGRFGDTLVQSGHHVRVVSKYIALNPIRKKYVKDPADWAWSSHAALIGKAPPRACLDLDEALCEFGGNNKAGRQNYLEFVLGDDLGPLDKSQLYAPIFGDKAFIKEQIGDTTDKELLKLVRPSLQEIIEVVASRSPANIKTRNQSIFKAVNDWGYSGKEVAEYLKMDRRSLYKILKKF